MNLLPTKIVIRLGTNMISPAKWVIILIKSGLGQAVRECIIHFKAGSESQWEMQPCLSVMK